MGLITHATADNIHGASAPRGRFRLYTLPGVENALDQPQSIQLAIRRSRLHRRGVF